MLLIKQIKWSYKLQLNNNTITYVKNGMCQTRAQILRYTKSHIHVGKLFKAIDEVINQYEAFIKQR